MGSGGSLTQGRERRNITPAGTASHRNPSRPLGPSAEAMEETWQSFIPAIPRLGRACAIACGVRSHALASATVMTTTAGEPARTMPHGQGNKTATGARILVLLLALAWGLNWIAAATALHELTPWSLRLAGVGLGAFILFAAAVITRHDLRMPWAECFHVLVAGFFNVAAFQILSAFAQSKGATSRIIIITYSMPIWTAVFSRILLGERLTAVRRLAVGLCGIGLIILIRPLLENGLQSFVFYSLGCALSWTIATVYIKWARITVAPLTNAAWQLLFGLLFIAAGTFLFEGVPHYWPASKETIGAALFVGVFGVGLAHFLWWSIVDRLPAVTAALGSLLVPVVGVTASAAILGERPTLADLVGFTMIFAAAACVLLQSGGQHVEMPE